MATQNYLLIIAGPTAIGKTFVSIALAKYFNTEIFSADSRQLYKEIAIGTARPSPEEQQGITHHMLDHVSILENFSAADFEKEVVEKLDELFKTHRIVILCGGTGLYIDAVCKGFDEGLAADEEEKRVIENEYKDKGLPWLQEAVRTGDPEYFAKADINNPRRLMRALEVIRLTGHPYSSLRKNRRVVRNFEPIKILLNEDREHLYIRINRRVDEMMQRGLLEEARRVYPYRNLNALNTVGYKELFDHFDGKTSLEEAVNLIKQHTRNYAKRQLTWFRKDKDYEEFAPAEIEKIQAYVEFILGNS